MSTLWAFSVLLLIWLAFIIASGVVKYHHSLILIDSSASSPSRHRTLWRVMLMPAVRATDFADIRYTDSVRVSQTVYDVREKGLEHVFLQCPFSV